MDEQQAIDSVDATVALKNVAKEVAALSTSNEASADRVHKRAGLILYAQGATTGVLLVAIILGGLWLLSVGREVQLVSKEVRALSNEVRETRAVALDANAKASEAAEEAKELAAEAPRIEAIPAASGKPASIVLVKPARKATPATSASAAMSASPAVSSIPIPIPAASP